MKKQLFLIPLSSLLILSILILNIPSESIEPSLLSKKLIYDENGLFLAIENKYSDRTFSQNINNTNLVNSGDGTPVDRLIKVNGTTSFDVFSTYGSFSFDRNDCTTTFYNYGINPTVVNFNVTNQNTFVEEMYWTVDNQGTTVDATQFACDIVISSNSSGKYLTATRNHVSGSSLSVTISSVIGQPFEDFVSFFNSITSWNNNLISLEQVWNGLSGGSIILPDGTSVGNLPIGSYSMNRTQLIKSGIGESILKISQGNNPFIIDLEKAKDKIGRIDLTVRTDGRVNLTFIFDNNVQPLPVGSSVKLDPQYKFEIKKSIAVLYKMNLSSLESGSRVIGGNVTVPVIAGNPNTQCKLYLVNDYLNDNPITDKFSCSGTNNVKLNKIGIDIMTNKIGSSASFQIKQINSNNVFNINEKGVVLDLSFKKPQYFALLDTNNIVTNVIVADDEFIIKQSGNFVETFIDSSQRGNYAGIGFNYNSINDVFIPPKPFNSWILNSSSWIWESPVPYPTDGNGYVWNESTLSWVLISG